MNDLHRTAPYRPATGDEVATLPPHIGRYRIERVLGKGGFGIVYLAHDDQLSRPVAIKVPHRHRISTPEDAEAYLVEARTVANLDHPNIVPVHDVGSTEDCPCFIVSKFIAGRTLAQMIKDDRPTFAETAELVATIAEALHYAHRKGLVHRDIKPGNILIDTTGKPFVVDFGLALKEENIGHVPKYAGTPAYMSPEQARGEGHRVDGRSDIFSLGVVFYELLVGRQPFHADSQTELMEQVATHEPRPPRQWDDVVPKELERICLKALAKRASERYTTAKDMADDLRHFLAEQTLNQQSSPVEKGTGTPAIKPVVQPPPTSIASSRSGATSATPTTPTSDSRPLKIVPKGLRSFDAHDADFFLELLPGPRDRDGLPDSIRFWKTCTEEKDADNTFSVGLIYGPSGCGKSSLVKAGLLPLLSDAVIAVYVEAAAEETETRLLNGLRKRCSALPAKLGLKETLAALRRGQGIPVGKKVLIVLDQFEQWLHAKKEGQNTELVQALRQCDGGRLQCIVMVRDDFWMATTRFLRELEIRLVEGQNSAAVDLFDLDHARKVLAAFGRAFSKLPENSGETSKDQKEFLNQAIQGLAQEGKVICVRLALFAEMMKGKPWTPSSLKAVGGTAGVGVTFLEETFSAATAPPEHRYHQKAARAVLKALLPESGRDIKGHMRSYAELLEASGYGSRPKDFDDLIRILDSEIRLITPTDPEGKDEGGRMKGEPEKAADSSFILHPSSFRYYQLTHDYLVHSLREWLTRKQKETRRGRAELLLADRAAVWNTRPENRQLPSLLQWLQIRWLTAKKNWTGQQQKMMRQAGRYHGVRGCVVIVLTILVGWAAYEGGNHQTANFLEQRILNVDTEILPEALKEIEPYRRWINPMLIRDYENTISEQIKLRASLALVPADSTYVDYLSGRLLDAKPNEVMVIRDALAPHKDGLLEKLWAVVENPGKGKESQRLRAAAALAKYEPESEKWAKASDLVVDQLVAENPVFLGHWMEGFRPIKGKLLASLASIYRDANRRESERSLATNILADYAPAQPKLLADLLMDADEKQFAVLYPKFKDHKEYGLPLLTEEADRKPPPDATEGVKERLAKRQANAAVALLRMDRAEKVWSLLKHIPDPTVRSYLIHRLSPLGADPRAIIRRLDEEQEVSIRRALLLSLGEFGPDQLSAADREPLLPKVLQLYQDDPDPGLHGAAEWLLRQWKEARKLKEMNETWAQDRKHREERLDQIQHAMVKNQSEAKPQWYVNSQGQTMVVIPGPVEFLMGSPPTEAGREGGTEGKTEQQHKKRISHSFAIAAREVTVEQFLRFRKDHPYHKDWATTTDCPVNVVNWYDSAAYCNWLSKQEGIPENQWCYLPNDKGDYAEGMKLAPDYLKRTGYRLPSEAEWEYACRARAVTSRYYGETEELLGKYVWYTKNSLDRGLLPGVPGRLGVKGDCLKPNDFGLFDMLGNAQEWCQDSYMDYRPGDDGKASEDIEDKKDITDKLSRVFRGGSLVSPSGIVRCATRYWTVPTRTIIYVGLRPARTFPEGGN
jgi:eukaryotic-like serine/threonine-protein kinase